MGRASNKILIFALKLSVSGISLFLIFRKTDMEHVAYILQNIGMPSFLTVSAIYIASQFVSTVRWRMLLPDK
ncbi:MAG TPA: hypothetical protein VEP69_00210, partial [Thermodesulfovibrionales bacterium]|nr:hypothetical protein [Thermodesulfovibrionales bacterium]